MGNLALKSKADISNKILEAMRNEDSTGFTDSLQAFGEALVNEMKAEYEKYQLSNDERILAARGIKPLTKAESKLAEGFRLMVQVKLHNDKAAKAALTDYDVVMPQTIVDKVFEDIKIKHELLSYIDFQNTSYSTKIQVSKLALQKAVWGSFDSEVTKELSASFEDVDMTLMSLTAFIPVSRGLLDLGPQWLISYITTMLTESIANGLEDGIINSLKTDEGPVGLIANLTTGSGDAGAITYTKKTPVTVKKLDPETVGKLLAPLAETPNGNPRVVNEVVMVINPKDWFTKVYPAITVLGADGTYKYHSVPFGIKFIQSPWQTQGEAVLFIPKGYFMGLGYSGSAGRIEYSDDYKFLERKRFFLTYLYANGFPKDNNVSVVLDIRGLKPGAIYVESNTATE